jgi:hypothetical protein
MPTQPHTHSSEHHDPFTEARATATDLLIAVGPADIGDLAGAVGAAMRAHEDALQAAERHPDAEWLRNRAIGATRVIAAMATSLDQA